MPRESKKTEANSRSGDSANGELFLARMVLAASVVVYLSLAGLFAAWLPSYPVISVTLMVFAAHSCVCLFEKDFG